MKLKEVNILGTKYKIKYSDKPSDIDIQKREALWGQIDYWSRTIRLYKNDLPDEEIFKILFHEIIHGILVHSKMEKLNTEKIVERLTNHITDTLLRNNLIKLVGGIYEN